MKPVVLNKRHCDSDVCGWPDVTYIGRPSRWGNPFSHMSGTQAMFKVETRDEAVESYRRWLWDSIRDGSVTLEELAELADQEYLVCWCAPAACHGDVLASAARWAKRELAGQTEPYRVIVCGTRTWSDRGRIADRLFDLPVSSVIVHGAARGADRIAGEEAQKAGLLVEEHPADWDTYGKRAGYLRNERMALIGAELCIAFWDGRSVGTSHMIDLARSHGIPVEIVMKD